MKFISNSESEHHQDIRSDSDATNNHTSDNISNKIFVRIYDSLNSFEIVTSFDNSFSDMECFYGNNFKSRSIESLPITFVRDHKKKSFLRRSFRIIRKNVARQSQRILSKYPKDKWKSSKHFDNNNNLKLVKRNGFNNTYGVGDRAFSNSADIIFANETYNSEIQSQLR